MVMAWLYHQTGHPMLLLWAVVSNTLLIQVTFHWMLTMFDKTVKTVMIFASIGFLLSGHFAPCNGDVLSFQALLANYTSQKHLGTSPNLTSDDQMQRSPATWPSPSESEAFLPYIKYTKFLGFMPKSCQSMPYYLHWCLKIIFYTCQIS